MIKDLYFIYKHFLISYELIITNIHGVYYCGLRLMSNFHCISHNIIHSFHIYFVIVFIVMHSAFHNIYHYNSMDFLPHLLYILLFYYHYSKHRNNKRRWNNGNQWRNCLWSRYDVFGECTAGGTGVMYDDEVSFFFKVFFNNFLYKVVPSPNSLS